MVAVDPSPAAGTPQGKNGEGWIMLDEFVSGLGSYLKTNIEGLAGYSLYKGELDNEGANWDIPKFPFVFIDFVSDKPEGYGADGETDNNFLYLNVLVALRSDNTMKLNYVEQVRDALDGTEIQIQIEEEQFVFSVTIREEGVTKLGYFKKVVYYNVPVKVELN
ncbi:MAG: hypothetical protein IAE90_07425 [Ignavibacteria bacterium]|nr:hypothetical protein [Ignavibacteria bacterium]